MPGKFSKRLVIDSDVMQSAGGAKAGDSTSIRCRDILITLRDVCHRLVETTEILEERRKHRSQFSQTWLASMNARKKIDDFSPVGNSILRNRLGKMLQLKEKKKYESLAKDIFLIEAALVADKIVISRDEEARKLLSEAAHKLQELKEIIWVNPEDPEFDCIAWLEQGAKPVKERFLGYTKNNL